MNILAQLNENCHFLSPSIFRTTTEKRYQSILNTMDQIVVEADDLALQFEKQLREKVDLVHFNSQY